ncbi:MAG TPA: VOC family protein [Rhodanobacteraceae bacterium]|nr:VOC family protein [Rhodanobacteraceae bacterium]
MHRSRLSNLVIDCLEEHFEPCVAFWAKAFGAPMPRRLRAGQRYVTLKTRPGDPEVLLQMVERDPGIHLDFETDSVVKESARMEAAGARRKYKIKTWQVMQDPSGNAFCVIRKQHPELLERMPIWPDQDKR